MLYLSINIIAILKLNYIDREIEHAVRFFFVLINILVGSCLSGSQVDEKFLVRREKFYEDFETEVLPPPEGSRLAFIHSQN